MKKGNPTASHSIPGLFLEAYEKAFPKTVDSDVYDQYVDAVFKYMIVQLFGKEVSAVIFGVFNTLYERQGWETGSRFFQYYHDEKHAKQVTIRTVYLLHHYGKIPDMCIAPMEVTEWAHSTDWYSLHPENKQKLANYFLDFSTHNEAALVLAAIFHDVSHSCGGSYDCFNIARAITTIEPQLHYIINRMNYAQPLAENVIRSTVKYIQKTEWPYQERTECTYTYILRVADLLSMVQYDWLQTCYYSLTNETVRYKSTSEITSLFLKHVLGQSFFLDIICGTLRLLEQLGFEGIRTFINGRNLPKCTWPLFLFESDGYWVKPDGPVNLIHLMHYRAFIVKQTLTGNGVLARGIINPLAVEDIVQLHELVNSQCAEAGDFNFLSPDITTKLENLYNEEMAYWSKDARVEM